MARRMIAAACVLAACAALPTAAFANVPPPPPPPPGCTAYCSGPPPPPTLVPTPAPTVVAPQPVVTVHVASATVPRGHTAKLSVEASTDDRVTLQIAYRHSKPTTWRGRVGSNGTLTRSWKVPKGAPVGVALLRVTVDGTDGRVQKLLVLHITR